jgi:hypothetical protein
MIIIPGGPIFPRGERYVVLKLAHCTAMSTSANTGGTLWRLDYPVMDTSKFAPRCLFLMNNLRFASHRIIPYITDIILGRNEATVCDFCLTRGEYKMSLREKIDCRGH